MNRIGKASLVVLLGCMLAGCGGQDNSNAAIQRAIEEHLASRPGLASNMISVEVTDVTFDGDTAEAEVVFLSTADQAARMAFRYHLRYTEDGWVVESGSRSDQDSAHPSTEPVPDMPSLPEGHPSMGAPPDQ